MKSQSALRPPLFAIGTRFSILLALAAMLLVSAVLQAATYTWTSSTGGTNDGPGTWGTANANWLAAGSSTAVNWVNNSDAIIGNGGTPGLISFASTPVVNNLTFQPVASGYYTFNSSNLRLGGSSGFVSTITVPAGVTADIGNGTSSSTFLAQGGGANGLICDGGGTLILSFKGTSTYSGNTTITNDTTVIVFTNRAFNASPTLNLGSGTLATHSASLAQTFANAVNLRSNFTLGNPTSKNMTFGTGAWTLSDGSWTLTVDTITAAINSAIGQDVSGRGMAFSSLNGGTLTLGYAGTEGYTGPTTINSGTLALGASCNLNAASGVAVAAGGTFDVSAQTTWTAGSSASPAITASGTGTAATIKGGTTVDFGTRPITLNYDGANDTMLTISQGALAMNGNTITINGGSTLSHGTHNIIAVTGGGITLSSTPTVIGTAIAPTDQAVVSTSGGTPNYVVITVAIGGPLVSATTKSAIGTTNATLGATVTSDNGSSVTNYGIVWGTSPSPTILSNKVQVGTSATPPKTFTTNVTGLPSGTLVYYRGYATSANGTGYSTNDSFVTLANEPTTQASGVSFSAVQGGATTVSWTRGNGSSCIVLVKAGSAVDSNPVDTTTYTANANLGTGTQIGTGNYVAYLGTSNSVTLLALAPSTTYHVAVYELNGSGGSENYRTTSPATGSQATALHPVTYYSSGSATDPTATGSWWTGNNGTGANPSDFLGGDTFIIQSPHNYTIASAATWTVDATGAGTAANVQINNGGTLTFTLTSTSSTLKLGGNLNQAAAGGIAGNGTTGTGIIQFTSNGSWTGSGDISGPKASIIVDSGVTLDASGMSAGFKFRSGNTTGITVNGSLNTGSLTISGNSGANTFFTLGTSGTLITATTSASGVPGIFTGFAATKITLPTTANYIFNGVAAQVTGTTANNATMPATVNNLTISNSAGVTLSQATTAGGTLTVNSNSILDLNSLTLTVSNPPALNGALKMEVTKTAPNTFTGSKLTQTAGTLAYGGTLTVVTNTGSLSLAGADVIDLFDAPAFNTGSSFSTVTCPSLLAGQSLSTAGLTVDGSITITAGGPSGPGYITNSISGSSLTLTWPAGQNWRLVSQTNTLSTGLNPNTNAWSSVSGGSDGSATITIDRTKPTVFYRLFYP